MKAAFGLLLLLVFALPSLATDLTVGLIPEQNVFKQMERYRPLGEYIEKKSGIGIRFTILSRYGNIIVSFVEEQLDGAFWGSFTGALAITKIGVEPLARPVWKNGTSTYHGYIFVRKDSGIRSVADMRGRSIAFVDRATTAGYVFPVAYFQEAGVTDIANHFSEFYFAGSHDATIHEVLEGEADVGCAKNTIFSLVAERDPRINAELNIIARSSDVPSNALAVRSSLPEKDKAALRRVLLEMSNDPQGQEILEHFGAREFIATTRADYAPVFEAAERAGIDLATYRYRNE